MNVSHIIKTLKDSKITCQSSVSDFRSSSLKTKTKTVKNSIIGHDTPTVQIIRQIFSER